MKYDNLKMGEKIYYTGDMANLPAEGKIDKVYSNNFYPILYDISLNNGVEKRVAHSISPANFEGVGKRFELMTEKAIERQKRIKELEKAI